MAKRKVNPKKKPATQADVKKAKSQAETRAVKLAWTILFTVLRDKEGMDNEDLQRIWGKVEDLSDSIAKGYVSLADLRQTLKEEANINLVD